MSEREVTVKNSDGTYSEAVIHQSGWSTFWKWTARIIIALVVASVVIYIVDSWVGVATSESADQGDGDGATLKIELGDGDSGDNASGDSN